MGKHFVGLVVSTALFLFSGTALAAGSPGSSSRLWFFSAGIGASSGNLEGSDLGLQIGRAHV